MKAYGVPKLIGSLNGNTAGSVQDNSARSGNANGGATYTQSVSLFAHSP